jgi:hypothetical protein
MTWRLNVALGIIEKPVLMRGLDLPQGSGSGILLRSGIQVTIPEPT